MNFINKAFMLELSHRLTVAVTMSTHELESFAWRSAWNDDTLSCARQWYNHLLHSIGNKDAAGIIIIQIVNGIVTGLSRGYVGITGNSLTPSNDVHIYSYLCDEAHKIAHDPVFAEWNCPSFSCWVNNWRKTIFAPIFQPSTDQSLG